MKIINGSVQKDPDTGKNKVMIELDEEDVILLGEVIRKYEQDETFDKDDHKRVAKIKHNREKLHEVFTLIRPS